MPKRLTEKACGLLRELRVIMADVGFLQRGFPVVHTHTQPGAERCNISFQGLKLHQEDPHVRNVVRWIPPSLPQLKAEIVRLMGSRVVTTHRL